MKFLFLKLDDQNQYRLVVFVRIFLAVFAGFLIANLTVATVGLLFPNQLAIATYTGFLLSFIVWLVFILAMFSMKTILNTVWLSLGLLFSLGCIVGALKIWGST
ncbi:hypothetical protein B9T33_14020 [Acinetobacter sp. ANC 5054]|uniref:hypothetical protein n=1 Tax=Acinetobacter sp. ANC 5054 TaxID=1977877 RepID=UPI000A34D503|nr:hypothetical protein [Acinetobacter sp. ANC 5054]OTG78438.1 hypothetical protein B9T33_14020 [Acinetobacter sp. ANC 5054]